MKKQSSIKKHTLFALICGLFAVALSMALTVHEAQAGSVQAGAQATPAPTLTAEPPTEGECSECHLDITDAWIASSHAHAYDDPQFNQRWDSLGKPGECLACHTTNYQATTNSFTGEGVQCEACHGGMVEDHPPAVVPVKADTDYCGSCHTTTLGEWRLTGHSTAGVGCTDCHDPHSQNALFEDPDEMCLNCHREGMGQYLEDLHIKKDIGCVDCHALVIPPETIPNDGIVPTGHAFTITTSTCVACHTDALHAGFSLPGYEHGAKDANGAGTEETQLTETPSAESISVEENLTSDQQIQALEAALASTRFSVLFQGGIIGLVLGGLTVYYLGRNQARRSLTKDESQAVTGAQVADGEAIDRELEKALILIERGVDWIVSNMRKVTTRRPSHKETDGTKDDAPTSRKDS